MKIFSSFVVSFMLVFLLFCIFWATIFSGYIQYYGIAVFFNPFFLMFLTPMPLSFLLQFLESGL